MQGWQALRNGWYLNPEASKFKRSGLLLKELIQNPSARKAFWGRFRKENLALKLAQRGIIAISEYVSEFLIRYLYIPSDKIGIVYQGVDLPENKKFIIPMLFQKNGKASSCLLLVLLGQPEDWKMPFMPFIIISNELPDIPPLVIAGETTSRMRKYGDKLKNWIKAYDLSSKSVGPVI